MCSVVTINAPGRVGRRAAGTFATNIGFYSTVSGVHSKYQSLYLVQNERAAEMGESLWVVCLGEEWGAEGDRDN